MSNDLKTTVSGVVAGIAGILALFNILIPQNISEIIVLVAVAVLGYYTNKPDKK